MSVKYPEALRPEPFLPGFQRAAHLPSGGAISAAEDLTRLDSGVQ